MTQHKPFDISASVDGAWQGQGVYDVMPDTPGKEFARDLFYGLSHLIAYPLKPEEHDRIATVSDVAQGFHEPGTGKCRSSLLGLFTPIWAPKPKDEGS